MDWLISNIIFGENCPLTRHLKEVSMLDSNEAQFAGALLSGLGFINCPRQLPDLALTAQVVQDIVKTQQTDFLSEATGKCVHCFQSNSCEVGALFMLTSVLTHQRPGGK